MTHSACSATLADEEPKVDINVIQLDPKDEESLLRKVVHILEDLHARELESNRYQEHANKLDKISFWIYLCIIVVYLCAIFYMMLAYPCEIDHFEFWY